LLTEEPRTAIRPTPSWPRISRAGPSFPDAKPKSVPQTPVAERETRSSSDFRVGRGSSLISNSNEKSSLRLRKLVNIEAIVGEGEIQRQLLRGKFGAVKSWLGTFPKCQIKKRQ
jgi:hypothetical protein